MRSLLRTHSDPQVSINLWEVDRRRTWERERREICPLRSSPGGLMCKSIAPRKMTNNPKANKPTFCKIWNSIYTKTWQVCNVFWKKRVFKYKTPFTRYYIKKYKAKRGIFVQGDLFHNFTIHSVYLQGFWHEFNSIVKVLPFAVCTVENGHTFKLMSCWNLPMYLNFIFTLKSDFLLISSH